jgi:hypothetical protein
VSHDLEITDHSRQESYVVQASGKPISRALASSGFQSFAVPIVVVGPEIIYGSRSAHIDEARVALGYEAAADPPPPASL